MFQSICSKYTPGVNPLSRIDMLAFYRILISSTTIMMSSIFTSTNFTIFSLYNILLRFSLFISKYVKLHPSQEQFPVDLIS